MPRDARGRFVSGGGPGPSGGGSLPSIPRAAAGPPPVEWNLAGAAEMAARLDKLSDRYISIVSRAIRIEAEHIMTRSKRDFVPVDLGTLRDSGHVQPVEVGVDGTVSVQLAYGGAAEPYAEAVHEYPGPSTPRSWRGISNVDFSPEGHGPKYLERPLMDAVSGMNDRIAQRVNKSIAAILAGR